MAFQNNDHAGNFKELAEKVHKSDEKCIVLSKDYINSDNYTSEGIKINKDNLIIKAEEGKEITIDAKNIGRIFDANNTKNITFENIKFINANSSSSGGAVLLGDEESNHVVNCEFENCYSDTFGGALNGNAINSTFIECSAKYHGGAIFDGSAENCTFEKCFSTSCGGAMSYNEAINCKFNDCYSYWRGGALYEVNSFKCSFVNCYSSEGGSMYEGSAFCCYFEMSGAKNGNGGGMYGGSAIGCDFKGCYVNNGTGSAMYEGTSIDSNFNANNVSDVNVQNSDMYYNFEDSNFKQFLNFFDNNS